MWLCHPDGHDRLSLWVVGCIISSVIHMFFLILFFFVYRSYYIGIINVNSYLDIPVVFVPLQNRTDSLTAHGTGTLISSGVHKGGVGSKNTTLNKKTTTVAKQQDKANKQRKIKKGEEKRADCVKKDNNVRNTKKEDESKKKIALENAAKKIACHDVPSTQKNIKTATAPSKNEPPSHDQNGSIQYTQAMQIGQQEYDFLQMYRAIQEQIEQVWHPPLGIHGEHACHIRVVVDWNGIIAHTNIEKSSGMLAYDISARSSLASITFPRSAYGKEMTINFST